VLKQLFREKPVPFRAVAKREGIHVATVYRWFNVGLNGVHLEAYKRGSGYVTSEEALERFWTRLTEAARGDSKSRDSARENVAKARNARRALAQAK